MNNGWKLSLLSVMCWSSFVLAGGTEDNYKKCPEKRPEICAQMYDPVCAVRDTGIRCIKAPCPSTENVTYSNGCTACSEPKVYGYRPATCIGGGVGDSE